MKEKKGDMTIGTLIAIILGLVVLVLLIVGFTGGWNNFMDKLNLRGNADSTLSDVESACTLACSVDSVADYCSVKQTLKNGGESVQMSCAEIENRGGFVQLDGKEIELGITCNKKLCTSTIELVKAGELCKENNDCIKDYSCVEGDDKSKTCQAIQ